MRSPRISIRSLMLAVAALGLALGLLLGGIRLCRQLSSMDLIAARQTLAAIDGIDDVRIHGYDDITYEVKLVTFALKGRPHPGLHRHRAGGRVRHAAARPDPRLERRGRPLRRAGPGVLDLARRERELGGDDAGAGVEADGLLRVPGGLGGTRTPRELPGPLTMTSASDLAG